MSDYLEQQKINKAAWLEEQQARRAAYHAVQWDKTDTGPREKAHHDYYLWLGRSLGMRNFINIKRLLASTDPINLNDIPLKEWDTGWPASFSAASRKGIQGWSMADSVCMFKALAREEVKNYDPRG